MNLCSARIVLCGVVDLWQAASDATSEQHCMMRNSSACLHKRMHALWVILAISGVSYVSPKCCRSDINVPVRSLPSLYHWTAATGRGAVMEVPIKRTDPPATVRLNVARFIQLTAGSIA